MNGITPNSLLQLQGNHTFSPHPPTTAEQELEFALVFSAAQKGLAEAQFRLANYYIDSKLIVADETEASYWLEEAI